MENNEIVKANEVNILVTNEDKQGTDITKMSNFFDNYLCKLNADLSLSENVLNDEISAVVDLNIISNAIKNGTILKNGGNVYVPNFDALPKTIREKLNSGEYKIGESRQVVGDSRAVIVDGEGTRVKDVTLKQVDNNADNLQITNEMIEQIQLQQISAKLDDVIELQKYQIETDRDRDIRASFLEARHYILLAQESKDESKIKESLEKAREILIKATSSIQSNIETTGKALGETTSKHGLQAFVPDLFKERKEGTYMKYIVEDLQYYMLYVGLQSQINYYLGDKESMKILENNYKNTLLAFCNKGYGKDNRPLAIIMHEHYPYNAQNIDSWFNFQEEITSNFKDNSKLIDSNSNIYVIELEESENER